MRFSGYRSRYQREIGSLTFQMAIALVSSLISHCPETDSFGNASPLLITSTDQPSRKSTTYGTWCVSQSFQVAARFTYGAQVVTSRSAGFSRWIWTRAFSSAGRHPPKTGSGKVLRFRLRNWAR